MADDKNDLSMKGLVSELLRRLLGREVLMLLAVCIFVAGVTLYGTRALGQTVDDRVDAGLRHTERQVGELQIQFDTHVKDAAEEKRQLKADLHEVQMDIRALYRAMQTGERQPRLERPLPQVDGGVP